MAILRICDICGSRQMPICKYSVPALCDRPGIIIEFEGHIVKYDDKEIDMCQKCAERIANFVED